MNSAFQKQTTFSDDLQLDKWLPFFKKTGNGLVDQVNNWVTNAQASTLQPNSVIGLDGKGGSFIKDSMYSPNTPNGFTPTQVASNGVPFSPNAQNQAMLSGATSMFSGLPQVQNSPSLNTNDFWNKNPTPSGFQTLTAPNASVTGSATVLDNPSLPPAITVDPIQAGQTVNPMSNFNANGNMYSNFLQDPTNSIGFNKTPNPAGDSFSNLFGLTDWLNGGTAKGDTNYMSSGDILGGIGSLASGAMGAYGMFTSLDQGQQQLDDASRRTDLLESKYNEELRHRSAIRDQNRAG